MMTLVNGKFFNDGKPYPLEFGNKEQLKLIEKVKAIRSEGAIPAFIFDETQKFICGIHLTCVCGSAIRVDWETEEEGQCIEGIVRKCTGCNFKYEVCYYDDSLLYLKLIN